MTIAPIGLTVYGRLEHLKKTVMALQQNTLASQSTLYIFSDAPKLGDEEKVENVRKYIKTITGFKDIHIYERSKNSRLENNRKGQKYLLDKYGRMIWMAEDIVTAPGFLDYMNSALDIYEHNDNILSICGYTPNIKNENNYKSDSFIFQNCLAWGMGIWKDKYEMIKPIDHVKFLDLIKDEKEIEYVKNNCGRSFVKYFEDECLGNNNHLDVRATFVQYISNMYTVYPCKSLVQNIGHDGSGLHSGVTDKFKVELWDKRDNFLLNKNIIINENIKSEMLEYFSFTNNSIDESVLKNIIDQINQSKHTSFSIWGTNQLTAIILDKANIKINHVVCTWATDHILYNGYKVITPQEALDNGETNFIIMSFASRFKMRDSILKMTDEKLNLIMYED